MTPPTLLRPTPILYTSLPFTLLHSHPFLPHARHSLVARESCRQSAQLLTVFPAKGLNQYSAAISASYLVVLVRFLNVVIVHVICTFHSCTFIRVRTWKDESACRPLGFLQKKVVVFFTLKNNRRRISLRKTNTTHWETQQKHTKQVQEKVIIRNKGKVRTDLRLNEHMRKTQDRRYMNLTKKTLHSSRLTQVRTMKGRAEDKTRDRDQAINTGITTKGADNRFNNK